MGLLGGCYRTVEKNSSGFLLESSRPCCFMPAFWLQLLFTHSPLVLLPSKSGLGSDLTEMSENVSREFKRMLPWKRRLPIRKLKETLALKYSSRISEHASYDPSARAHSRTRFYLDLKLAITSSSSVE